MADHAELPPDDALVSRLRGHDETAFALVLDAWSGGMLRLARSFVSTTSVRAWWSTCLSMRQSVVASWYATAIR